MLEEEMGFLKKSNAPSELPNLAIDSIGEGPVGSSGTTAYTPQINSPEALRVDPLTVNQQPAPVERPKKEEAQGPAEATRPQTPAPEALHVEIGPSHDDIKKVVDKNLLEHEDFKDSYFDELLEDINSGITDAGKLEDWQRKFAKEDVVSGMRGYWEGNKADIIIKSFGAEYKKKINDKVKVLQDLEEDWREIYFKLVKKEEEMKKEERELKEVVSEFVNLCKEKKIEDSVREKIKEERPKVTERVGYSTEKDTEDSDEKGEKSVFV